MQISYNLLVRVPLYGEGAGSLPANMAQRNEDRADELGRKMAMNMARTAIGELGLAAPDRKGYGDMECGRRGVTCRSGSGFARFVRKQRAARGRRECCAVGFSRLSGGNNQSPSRLISVQPKTKIEEEQEIMKTRTTMTVSKRSRAGIHASQRPFPVALLCLRWLFFALLFTGPLVSRAETYVSGVVVGETWNAAGSPYRVVGDILVAELDIGPNTWVLFEGSYVFEVAGVLRAAGTEASPIVFTRTNGAGGWKGIYFNDSQPGSALIWCNISNTVATLGAVKVQNQGQPVMRFCTIANNSANEGAGIWADIKTGDFLIESCAITDNYATAGAGGGILAKMSAGNLHLSNCLVANNRALTRGGGMQVWSETNILVMERCDVSNNTVNPGGARGSSFGGGIDLIGNGLIRDSVISSNRCRGASDARQDFTSGGAGVVAQNGNIEKNAHLELVRCQFIGNWAEHWFIYQYYSMSRAYGGGLYVYSGSLNAENCVWNGNKTTAGSLNEYQGAGIRINSGAGPASIVNCTLAYNNTEGLRTSDQQTLIMNSIVYFNNSGGTQITGTTNVMYCDVQNGYPGEGNANSNPIFHRTTNLVIVTPSKCIDAGNPDPAFNDVCFAGNWYGARFSLGTVRNDMGAHGGPGACGWIYTNEPVCPFIIADPQSRSGCLGQTAEFSVTAGGAAPLGYQWYHDTMPLIGETNTTLVLTNLESSHAGAYWVQVSNSCGSTNSAPAWLTVYDACIDLRMYAGLEISGEVGATYVLSCTTNVADTNSWWSLATNVMSPSGWFFLDMESPWSQKRFYKAVRRP